MSNVLHFGAKGDGKTDDTAAILHALKDGDGVLEFPRGTYLISKTITIKLAETGRCAITGLGGVAKIVMTGEGPAFHLIGTHMASAHPPDFKNEIWASQRMPTVTQIEIEGPATSIDGPRGAQADGFLLEGTMQATFEAVLIRNVRHGIRLHQRNRNVLISHCHIYHNTGIGVFLDSVNLHQINITGSHISYNRQGGIRVERSEVRNFQITGNDIEYNNHRTFKNFFPEPTAEITIDCSDEKASVREGTIASNTIQATQSAGANIRFIGAPAPGSDNTGALNHKTGMWTITGNLIGSQEINIHLLRARGIVVSGNFIYSGHQRNILVDSCKNIVLSGNCFEHNPDYTQTELCTGVRLVDCENMTFNGSILHDCMAGKHSVPTETKFERDALLEIVRCKRVNICGCNILDGVPAGVLIDKSEAVQITGCTIVDTREKKLMKEAVRVTEGSTKPLMTGNAVE